MGRPFAGPVLSAVRHGGRLVRLCGRAAMPQVWGYLLLEILIGAQGVAAAWLTKAVIDALIGRARLADVVWPVAILSVLGLVRGVAPLIRRYVVAEIDRRAALTAQDELFAAVERFVGLDRLEDPVFLDRLRLAQQSVTAPGGFLEAAFGVIRGVVSLVGFVGSLALISPAVTGIVVIAAVPGFVAEFRVSRRRHQMFMDIGPAQRREMFYANLLTSAQAAKEIRLFRLGPFLRGRMTGERRATDAARRRLDRRELTTQTTLVVLSIVASSAGLLWMVAAAGRGQLTIGDVSVFIAAVAATQSGLTDMIVSTTAAYQDALMFEHYEAVLRAAPAPAPVPPTARPATLPPTPSTPPASVPAAVPALRDGIRLREVWFRYSDDHDWVLRGVDMFIPAGATIALIGANGAGKSTLVKLLCRLYEPTRGAILWDGTDIRHLPPEELRDRMGAVFQDFMAYDFSAADNIAVGELSALDDEVRLREAAELAGVHDTISALPRGYRTLLTRMFVAGPGPAGSDVGVLLSGGQWQRVALARAYVRKDRDVMILDEPSSGLDADTEHDLHTRLKDVRSGRTSILISHRLGAVRDADMIFVLRDGVVAEQGTHARLLALDGDYARMFGLQAAGYQSEHPTGERVG
ncbi:ABC transporter ATP-binding protein [Nonomuraea rhodomycinica]|uniref:ABC transporter ATP-binding protein n=1 Tax=Nonomuraea rhodomycinica TaxID=1712872 RepID=A0A7Y6ME24_9ACTN|nr:ABC transporter ATP-binding protein [Nonomuraea rhodomycinica]NUW44462.1 ABC transporter ATP-binding protein [Nonomuraea rhodomycinica]